MGRAVACHIVSLRLAASHRLWWKGRGRPSAARCSGGGTYYGWARQRGGQRSADVCVAVSKLPPCRPIGRFSLASALRPQ